MRRVLVVDDEKLIVKGIRFSLEQDNMQVDCAYDGEEAVEYARNNQYDIILLADHGGHDRSHGTDMPEDMTIPIIGCGPSFTPGELPEGLSIKDIAPTITKLLGAAPADEWEGKPIID